MRWFIELYNGRPFSEVFMHRSSRLTLGVVALAFSLSPTAQLQTRAFPLTVDSIMRGPALVGYPPTGLRWSGDSSTLYFEWRHPGEDEASTWAVARTGGQPRKLGDAERKTAPPVNGVWDRAHRRVLFADAGDVAIVDTTTGVRRQITHTTGTESNPRWARHETAVTFVRDNNLFLVPLDSGTIEQLTDIAPKKRDARETDSQKFVKAEEETLIEHTRTEAEKRKRKEEKDKASALPKYELAEHQTAPDLQLAPDGTHVFVVVAERSEAARRPNVPTYVTESSYTEDIPARTFVGDAQEKRSLVVMNLETGKSAAADAGFAGKRSVRWSMAQLNDDGSLAVAHVRADDNKDRWLVVVDPESGKARVLDTLHDDAWVREVGGFGPNETSFGFLDAKRVWFLSERDGWMHLYSVDATATQPAAKPLTQGKWEIDSAVLSRDRTRFYITSTEEHPGERHLYSMSVDGGARTKVTSMTGSNVGEVSQDDSTVGMVYSYSNKPPEVYVMPNRAGAAATQVTTSTSDEWRGFKWIDPKLVTYKTRDGVDVYARL